MAGGAITSRSVAEEEYDECLIKVKTILEISSGEKVNAE
jgi:anthranilate/para-aminobenzoate synthase component I